MAEELLQKNAQGTFVLSDRGEYLAYYNALRHLLAHYMSRGLQFPPEKTQKVLSETMARVNREFKTVADFRSRIAELPAWIGEPNTNRLISYIGQHFISTLEKTRAQLMEKELPKARDKFDNPYRTPSWDFLDLYGDLFLKAPPVLASSAQENRIAQMFQSPTTAPAAEQAPVPKQSQESEDPMPGERLLKLLTAAFLQSPKHQAGSVISPVQSENSELPSPVPQRQSAGRDPMPGEILLSRYQEEFLRAPLPVSIGSSEQVPVYRKVEAFLSPDIFFRISETMNGFIAKKDKEGYQNWFSTLAPREKQAIHLRTLVQREERGESIQWDAEYSRLHVMPGDSLDKIQEYAETVREYMSTMKDLRNVLAGQNQGLYQQLLVFISSPSSKADDLDMMLLQVSDPTARNNIREQCLQLLDNMQDYQG